MIRFLFALIGSAALLSTFACSSDEPATTIPVAADRPSTATPTTVSIQSTPAAVAAETAPSPTAAPTEEPERPIPSALMRFPTATPVPDTPTTEPSEPPLGPDEFLVDVVEVIDGDTLKIELGQGQIDGRDVSALRFWNLRLLGVDTPETRTSDEFERACGNHSRSRVEEFVKAGGQMTLVTEFETDSFGRLLGDLESEDGTVLTEYLLVNRLAVEFNRNSGGFEATHGDNCRHLASIGLIPPPPSETTVPRIESATATSEQTTDDNEAPDASDVTTESETRGLTFETCEDAAAAGVPRVRGDNGDGLGFLRHVVPNTSIRDGDGDGVVCEVRQGEVAEGAERLTTPIPASQDVVPTPEGGAMTDPADVADDKEPDTSENEESETVAEDVSTPTPISEGAEAESTAETEAYDSDDMQQTETVEPDHATPESETDSPSMPFAKCDDAEDAGLPRVKGPEGDSWGFPIKLVNGPRDGDSDGVVCEITYTPTPRDIEANEEFQRSISVDGVPGTPETDKDNEATDEDDAKDTDNATPTTEFITVTPGKTYSSCPEADAAGLERVQGTKGPGRGFPVELVVGPRDGDGDGVVCEE